jgi:hypothetical protein
MVRRHRATRGYQDRGISVSYRLDGLVEVDCPECGYGLELDITDVRCQVSRYCSACKTRLALHDGDGSIYGAEQDVSAALRQLDDMFSGLNLTIEF